MLKTIEEIGKETAVTLFSIDGSEEVSGLIRVNTAVTSNVFQVPEGMMPADLVFSYISTLNQTESLVFQASNDVDFPTNDTKVLATVPVAIGSVTPQSDYENGPDRFMYYRVIATAGSTPASGGLGLTVKPFWN